MKFSIITPEHDPHNISFLRELYDCIVKQTYSNWEWIIFLNGKCTPQDLPEIILDDDRVFIYHCHDVVTNIGDIKHQAFHLGTGDVLVEVDHDDLITPDCLEELNVAFNDNRVGFVYSNNAVLHMTEEFKPFDASYGWSHTKFEWNKQSLFSMNSFPATSHSLGYIWYAPDHVRAWRSDVYRSIGGHNRELSICDDHELMIRTYLVTKMHHIDKVLYVYRITGNNTWLARNEAIQIKTVELFNQYARALAEKDAKDRNLLLVDIGAGINPLPGYTTVDLNVEADITHDLNNGLPFEDNSVGVLNASHIIEHLRDPVKTMSEIHRVLAHGGWAFIEVPSTDGRGAFQDPTHVSFWNENSFLYYTDQNLAKYIGNDKIKFQEFRRETTFPNEWMQQLNVCVTTAWLVAVKPNGNRLPHSLKI